MDKYEVKITDNALSDMEKIYNYIATDLLSSANAIGQYNRIADAILSLEVFPKRYPLFETEPEHSRNLRKMSVDNYLVCYIADETSVTVTNVLYGASDIHEKLKN